MCLCCTSFLLCDLSTQRHTQAAIHHYGRHGNDIRPQVLETILPVLAKQHMIVDYCVGVLDN